MARNIRAGSGTPDRRDRRSTPPQPLPDTGRGAPLRHERAMSHAAGAGSHGWNRGQGTEADAAAELLAPSFAGKGAGGLGPPRERGEERAHLLGFRVGGEASDAAVS